MKIGLHLLFAIGWLLFIEPGYAQTMKQTCVGQLQVCDTQVFTAVGLIQHHRPINIVFDSHDETAVLHAAHDLQTDLQQVAGGAAVSFKSASAIIVGTLNHSEVIDRLVREHKLNVDGVTGVWEAFVQQVVEHPMPGIDRALVIAGNDRRGTVFGIYDLSAQIGVSPWYWWADVPIHHHENLYITAGRRIDAPKVKYRGIFLNDEDPSLKGWVNEKFGGFNHQFYEHVFELILRLKGNYLWPAMWGKSIYDDDPESPKLANERGIVLGTSHHEPMMRAHVEWQRYGGGTPWDYSRNEDNLQQFWRKGIERMGNNESIVTVGMRGDGDEPMSKDTAIDLLEKIVHDQRNIIADVTHRDPAEVPQIWALYKEVQDYYDQGMQVPDDITLLFSDDNWGNIRRVPKLGEKRHGGYGMYYHFDYVGGPRNYKWINTNQIERVWEQMHIAYNYGIDRVWIVNVGDLKPMEYPINFFMDYAWNPDAIQLPQLKNYPQQWAEKQFGYTYAKQIGALLTRYTQYNARRKPELLSPDTYSLTNYHEAERVVIDYNALVATAEKIGRQLPVRYRDAYFQLVQYPIAASANLNELYVTDALNKLHAAQGRADTNQLTDRVDTLFTRDSELTAQYHAIGHGRWNHFMDQTHIGYTNWQQPDVNVKPIVQRIDIPQSAELGIAVEGDTHAWPGTATQATLPELSPYGVLSRYIDVFSRGTVPARFTLKASVSWLKLSEYKGSTQLSHRVQVKVNWNAAPTGEYWIPIFVQSTQSKIKVLAHIINPIHAKRLQGFVEADGYIAMEAAHFTHAVDSLNIHWQIIPELGRTLSGVTAFPVTAMSQSLNATTPHLEYAVNLLHAGKVNVQVMLAPTLNFTGGEGLRYAVSIDDGMPQIINMHAGSNGHADNSDPLWNSWVADNINIQTSSFDNVSAGAHLLKLWMVDPGVVFERMILATEPVPASYLGAPEH